MFQDSRAEDVMDRLIILGFCGVQISPSVSMVDMFHVVAILRDDDQVDLIITLTDENLISLSYAMFETFAIVGFPTSVTLFKKDLLFQPGR